MYVCIYIYTGTHGVLYHNLGMAAMGIIFMILQAAGEIWVRPQHVRHGGMTNGL